MPLRPFIMGDSNHPRLRPINLAMCDSGIFEVVNPSSIRLPKRIYIQDVCVLDPKQKHWFLDVSDLDGNDMKVTASEQFIFVDGKREFFDGKSWVHHQICRRFSLPHGYKVKSVSSKRLSNDMLVLTVNFETRNQIVVTTVEKTVLMCEGLIIPTFGKPKLKLYKIQPRVIFHKVFDFRLLNQRALPSVVKPNQSIEQPHNIESNNVTRGQNQEVEVQANTLYKDAQVQTNLQVEAPVQTEESCCEAHAKKIQSRFLRFKRPWSEKEFDGEDERPERSLVQTTHNQSSVWEELAQTPKDETTIDMDCEDQEIVNIDVSVYEPFLGVY